MKFHAALLIALPLALGACSKQASTNDSAAASDNGVALSDANLTGNDSALIDNGADTGALNAANGADAATGNASNTL